MNKMTIAKSRSQRTEGRSQLYCGVLEQPLVRKVFWWELRNVEENWAGVKVPSIFQDEEAGCTESWREGRWETSLGLQE